MNEGPPPAGEYVQTKRPAPVAMAEAISRGSAGKKPPRGEKAFSADTGAPGCVPMPGPAQGPAFKHPRRRRR